MTNPYDLSEKLIITSKYVEKDELSMKYKVIHL